MYICRECGEVFNEPAVQRETHDWLDGSPSEEWAVCPNCSSSDYSEAVQCGECGVYFSEEDTDKFVVFSPEAADSDFSHVVCNNCLHDYCVENFT